ncbi:hypothetical protein [Microbacterium candidum]|uniref:Uncharacterized protein n=1 Tax=Microbacterium candidum TaxID=3041922 RepID=A0ABT7MWC8_9MICO|nr:hypothetical protein [Microbacterium sp. ASV49]MDL9978758.1 hypothetical protein [Microbacterium sp. ASV49]
MSSHALAPAASRTVASGLRRTPVLRKVIALAAIASAVALMIVGGLLPWIVLFNGMTPVRGFSLDGGFLALLVLAVVALLFVQARHGSARILRPIAVVAASAVVADSLYSAWRISLYVGAPGPTGVLTDPSACVGPYVFAAAGAVLVAAALIAPAAPGRMGRRVAARLALALLLLVAAIIHLILTPEHLGVSTLLGVGFLLAGLAQLALAGFALSAPDRAEALGMDVVIVVDIALIVIYIYAVVAGLPLEAGHAADDALGLRLGAGEPVDVKGGIDLVAEVAAVGLAAVLALRPPRPLPGARARRLH